MRSSSSSSAPLTRHRLRGARDAAAELATWRQANASRRKRRRWRNVQFAPVTATSIVMSMSETRRSKGKPRVLVTPSRCPPQNSPVSVLSARLARIRGHLQEVVHSVGTSHFNGQRSSMHVWKLQNAENDEIVNVYIPNRLAGWGVHGLVSSIRSARVQHIPFSSSKCSSQLWGMRGTMTCFLTREGGTSYR